MSYRTGGHVESEGTAEMLLRAYPVHEHKLQMLEVKNVEGMTMLLWAAAHGQGEGPSVFYVFHFQKYTKISYKYTKKKKMRCPHYLTRLFYPSLPLHCTHRRVHASVKSLECSE